MSNNRDIFAELNATIKENEGKVPDRFTIGGEEFQRVGAKAAGPVKRSYKHPKTGKVTEEMLESVLVNVAPHADRITLDGVIYLANRSYDVPKATADTMRDIISNTWRHEAQTGGAYSFGNNAARNHRAAGAGVGFAQ